jgi:S1-C subfamily serine protease
MTLPLKTFAMLLACLMAVPTLPASALTQSRSLGKVEIIVTLKDNEQVSSSLQHFALLIKKLNSDSPETIGSSTRVKTTSDGSIGLAVVPGEYLVESEKPLIVNDKAYEWSLRLSVGLGKTAQLELNDDNATVTAADEALKRGRIVDETDLLAVLRDGVVKVQGELTHGTGFIVDSAGLILTNQHVIAGSNELRVQFEGGRKLVARLVAEDRDSDLAVLWVNLSSCPGCKTLTLAEPEVRGKALIDGARVFAISSTMNRDKSLMTAMLVKTEQGSINVDIPLKVYNSGAPVFNPVGDVIGILKFVGQNGSRAQTAGIIRIEEAQVLLARAKKTLKDASTSPSAELLPTEPHNSYPVEALKDLDLKKFKSKPYEAELGKYQLMMITPVLKYYITERNRIELARWQKKNEKNANVVAPVATDSFRHLRNWADYVNQMRPVVHLLVIPETAASGKSTFLSWLVLGVGAMGGSPILFFPRDYKFKADFKEMSMTCDGKVVVRYNEERLSSFQNYQTISR